MTDHPSWRLGSLCTGYGGLDMAFQQVLGGSLAWVADNDPGATRILAHHHPQVPNLGDLTAVDWSEVPPVDVLVGGYPCQPFSFAGHRKGVADERHIWPHLATALGVLRPRYAVFENVAGHLSLGLDTVLADLAHLGFDARWVCVRASDIGAAHQRKRLFLLAWPAHTPGPGRPGQGISGRAAHSGHAVAHALDVGGDRHRPCDPQRDEPAPCGLAAADTDLGGERAIQHHLPGRQPHVVRSAVAHVSGDGRHERRPEPTRYGRGPGAAVGGLPDWGDYTRAIHRWERVCGRPAPRPTDPLGRLNPPFVEWLMGLPGGHVTDVPDLSRSAQLKALGAGVIPQQGAFALRLLTTPGAHAQAA